MGTRHLRAGSITVSIALLGSLVGTGVARAQSGSDKSAAEALFDEAKKKLEAKDYPAACKAFEASQRLDPGIGTLLFLADCYEKEKRFASAWATFREAASGATAAGQGARASVATKHAAALENRLARLAVNVPAGSDVTGLEIHRDGALLPKAVWSTALPIDPGDHTVEAIAPGRKLWSTKITTDDNPTTTAVDVPVLEMAPAAPLVVPPPGPAGGTTPGAQTDTPPASSKHGWNTQTTIGLVVGVVGLGGIGLGTGFGVDARSLNRQAGDNCRPTDPTKCNATGVSVGKQARNAATVSTVGFIAGSALLATGVVVMLTSMNSSKSKAGWILEGGPSLVAQAPGFTVGRTW